MALTAILIITIAFPVVIAIMIWIWSKSIRNKQRGLQKENEQIKSEDNRKAKVIEKLYNIKGTQESIIEKLNKLI